MVLHKMIEHTEIRKLANNDAIICKRNAVHMVGRHPGADIRNTFDVPAVVVGLPGFFYDFCEIDKRHFHYFRVTHVRC